MHTLTSELKSSCLKIEPCSVEKLRQEPDLRLRLAEILQDAVWAPPWALRWEIGRAHDSPSAEGTISAYHNLLFTRPGADCFLFVKNNSAVVGYALGAILTDELIVQTHIGEGLNDPSCGPKPGDYYLAVTAIQGEYGVYNTPRENFRCAQINGTSVYRSLVLERVKSGYRNGARTFWVRTATGQEKVRGMYGSLKFSEVGQSNVKQGVTSVARTVMSGTFSSDEEINSVFTKK